MSTDGFKDLVKLATSGTPLNNDEMYAAMMFMLEGAATPAQIAAFLTALKMRGETIEELASAAMAMRTKAERFESPEGTIDTCGTGGTGLKTFNVSTAVAFVLAGCGIPVAKHGNKALSSLSGSSDVLSKLGVNLLADFSIVKEALHEIGVCFLFAQRHHSAVKHVAPIRVELGIRTFFNAIGPLTNPAGAKFQLLGVYDKALCDTHAQVLKSLGSTAAWVVHGADGMDELTLTGESDVSALSPDGTITRFTSHPEQFGLPVCAPESLNGGTVTENAASFQALMEGAKGAYRDIVLMNAAAGLVIVGAETDRKQAVLRAAESIDSGAAKAKLKALIEKTTS